MVLTTPRVCILLKGRVRSPALFGLRCPAAVIPKMEWNAAMIFAFPKSWLSHHCFLKNMLLTLSVSSKMADYDDSGASAAGGEDNFVSVNDDDHGVPLSKADIHARRARKNAQSRARASALKARIAIIQKNPGERTEEEISIMKAYDLRRNRKNDRSRERALEKKEEIDRLLSVSGKERSKMDDQFLENALNAKHRKNQGDRNRRIKLKCMGIPAKMGLKRAMEEGKLPATGGAPYYGHYPPHPPPGAYPPGYYQYPPPPYYYPPQDPNAPVPPSSPPAVGGPYPYQYPSEAFPPPAWPGMHYPQPPYPGAYPSPGMLPPPPPPVAGADATPPSMHPAMPPATAESDGETKYQDGSPTEQEQSSAVVLDPEKPLVKEEQGGDGSTKDDGDAAVVGV
jgi:hypothetical protein